MRHRKVASVRIWPGAPIGDTMQLSRQELKLALSLQRRLRFLRWWDNIGKVICYPWTCYKQKQLLWTEHLQWLWNKKQMPDNDVYKTPFSGHANDIAERYCEEHCGNPLNIVKRFEQMALDTERKRRSSKKWWWYHDAFDWKSKTSVVHWLLFQ